MADAPQATAPSPDDALARQLAELTARDDLPVDRAAAIRRVAQLGRLTARSARTAGIRAVASGRWATDVAMAAAAHLPVRDLETLRDHHHGVEGAELAYRLVERAAAVTASVGAVVGGLAAAEELTPALWPSLPVEIVAETLLVVAIEMKLVAELHEVAGRPLTGSLADRAVAISRAWADRRGIDAGALVTSGGADVLGRQARLRLTRTLQKRIVRRGGRSAFSLAPFLAGAAAGGVLNRRATRSLGEELVRSLGLQAT